MHFNFTFQVSRRLHSGMRIENFIDNPSLAGIIIGESKRDEVARMHIIIGDSQENYNKKVVVIEVQVFSTRLSQ